MKKLLVAVLVGIMTVSLGACGDFDNNSDVQIQATVTTTEKKCRRHFRV